MGTNDNRQIILALINKARMAPLGQRDLWLQQVADLVDPDDFKTVVPDDLKRDVWVLIPDSLKPLYK